MPTDLKKLIPILIVLLFAFAGSYLAFLKYNPKPSTPTEEVKGASVHEESDLPMPISSEKICSSKTSYSNQTTFQTKKSPEEVLTFYQNVFSDKKWVPESDKRENGIYVTTYKNMDTLATITITKQKEDEYTIVSLKIAQL
ncbi:MAG: hypothetical protein KatS3mg101_0192 [Patescibacteria group bacterium]|nr:MAG: hypothetical protein KatS3mg101_0192 [Patescibacteria group bacterium]